MTESMLIDIVMQAARITGATHAAVDVKLSYNCFDVFRGIVFVYFTCSFVTFVNASIQSKSKYKGYIRYG